jgi:regulator of sirC expression with transglutaminase-like and TPR domain
MTANRQEDFRELFAWQVSLPETQLELDRAALYLAGEEYPDLEVTQCLRQLNALADEVRAAAGGGYDREALVKALNFHLFEHLGFTGNPDDYYNPENSFLNRVLDTRIGIPIALSVLYLEVARRLGLKCYGVGMPGHFLVALEDLDLYLDPFHTGLLLSAGDCRRLAVDMFGPALAWNDNFLAPCPKRVILFRMLNNLKQIYLRSRDYQRGINALQRMILIDPDAISLYKELAWCQVQLRDYLPAIRSLENYLRRGESPQDSAEVERQIRSLRTALAQFN